MIRIKIEMVPFGEDAEANTIGEITIVNSADHELRPQFGNYNITAKLNDVKREFRIEDHERIQGLIPLLVKICKRWELHSYLPKEMIKP